MHCQCFLWRLGLGRGLYWQTSTDGDRGLKPYVLGSYVLAIDGSHVDLGMELSAGVLHAKAWQLESEQSTRSGAQCKANRAQIQEKPDTWPSARTGKTELRAFPGYYACVSFCSRGVWKSPLVLVLPPNLLNNSNCTE